MKRKLYEQTALESSVVRDREGVPSSVSKDADAMVRTQVYLTTTEHEFLLAEARRTGGTMASILRSYVDEKMAVPADAWLRNPLLAETPEDPAWDGPEDLARNVDHYLYGLPKLDAASEGQKA